MKHLYRHISLVAAAALMALMAAGACAAPSVTLPQLDDCFTEKDLSGDWDATAIEILLTGETAETRANAVSIEGGTVTIMDGGMYVLSGTLDDGTIVIDLKDDERVQLVLDGVDITCSDGPAIYVKQADKVFITLAEGTENRLSNGGSFAEEGVEAVIYADEDLTFNGTGALAIDSPAGDGIDGKDDVKFASGTYVITASGRGIDANDSIRIADGSFTITTDDDAMRARHENNEDLGYVYIWGGTFDITAGGGAANGAQHADAMAFGGMMGGHRGMGGQRPSRAAQTDAEAQGTDESAASAQSEEEDDMPVPPDFTGEEGEMPEMPGFTGEEGEMPEMPDFTGEEGEMPERPDFAGEEGEMPAGFAEAWGGASASGTEAEDTAKGIKASGDIVILGGTFSIDVSGDALHADRDLVLFDGMLTIAAGDDAVHADKAVNIMGGYVDITQSYEGIEGEDIYMSGGDIRLVASDDGLNASADAEERESFSAQEGVVIEISGGTLYVDAEGDGIDSNGDLTVTGGTIVVDGPQNSGNGALDYNGTAVISGGTVVAAGSSGMAEVFSEGSTQASFLTSLSGQAGEIAVTDADGGVVVTAEVGKDFSTVVVSAPALQVGETYTVACGDKSVEVTLTGTVTGADAGGMNAMGGMFGHKGQHGAQGGEEERQEEQAAEASEGETGE